MQLDYSDDDQRLHNAEDLRRLIPDGSRTTARWHGTPDSLREIDIALCAFEVKYYVRPFLVFPPAGEGRRLDAQP